MEKKENRGGRLALVGGVDPMSGVTAAAGGGGGERVGKGIQMFLSTMDGKKRREGSSEGKGEEG